MGKVSFKYGTASQLTNAPYSEGTFYVISDNGSTDGILYADLNNKRICFGDVASLEDDVSELSSSIPTKISELIDDSDFIKQYYGTCGTAAATVQKEVTIDSITELTTGLTIFVKFTYANTAANPTLKLNNFDTKYIKRYGTTAPSTSAASSWNAGGIVSLTYDGTYWYLNDWNNTTYSAMSESEMKTGTATTARNITATRLKQAVEYHAPVSSVNGQTGEVSINIPTVPTNVSDFTNDAGYLTSYTETDPTVPSWAKQSTKPTYTATEVGALPSTTAIPSKTSDLTNDSGYLTEETDPTVPSWAKASTKPSYNFSEIGSTPTTISGYGITDAYTKTQVDSLVAGVLHYKGTKATVSALPSSNNTTGDTWHVTADGSEWAWDGTTWQELGTAVDLSDYVTTDDSRLSDARTPTAHNQALSTITGADDLKAIEGLTGTSGLLKKTAANTWTLDTSNYLTSYTETDPVFSASAAANISSTDISNWNSKTSNTGTVTSIGLSNATNGGLTISGSPVTNSGSITVGHSNILSSAQTTQAVYPIKIDKNGHISAYGSAVSIPTKVSDLTNDSGFISSYTEIDPVFSASAAAGITSTDISNWNAKSDTDEKLKTTSVQNNTTYYPIIGNMTNVSETKYYSGNFRYSKSSSIDSLQLGQVSSSSTAKGRITLCSGPYYTHLDPPAYNTINENKTYTLPNAAGTIALTSDIPQIYSSTNTNGYLTMATLPIYDGTVV